MALKKITAADFNAAIKKLTTSNASVWWKTLGTTEDGTELCFVMGWNEGYDEDDEDTMYQQDGYTLCSKIGYKHSNLMVMDYSDFNMPYDKKSGEVWDTDMSVGKGEVTDDAFDVKWYNDEAEAIWNKYGKPDSEGNTALDLMESKKQEAKKHTCSMAKKIESLAKKNEAGITELEFVDVDDVQSEQSFEDLVYDAVTSGSYDVDWDAAEQGVLNNDLIFKIKGYYPEATTRIAQKLAGTGVVLKVDGVIKNEDTYAKPTESHKCSMQKTMEALAKKSESKKSEGVYGTIRVDSENIAIKVQESNVYPSSSGRSLSVEVPKVEAWFSTLSEFSDCIDGMAEDCNGYPDISRDGSDILVQINAPKEDESDDYEVIVELRCSTEITSTSLEGVVDLLNHD